MVKTSNIETPVSTPRADILYHERYFVSDDLPWLVFVHGAGGNLLTWKYQVKDFKGKYNLLLIDMRDHGRSKNIQPTYDEYDFDIITDDIIRSLEYLKVEQAHFLSLSLGSIILQKLHERKPEMFLSMIMAGGVFKADWKIRLFAHSGKFLSNFIPFHWLYDIFSLIVLPRKNHQRSRQLFRRQSKKLAPQEFLKWLGLYRDFFAVVKRFFHKRLETTSLIIVGGQDHVFIRAAQRFAAKQAHLAKLVIMEGCGHICNVEKAQLFNEIVLQFLRDFGEGRKVTMA